MSIVTVTRNWSFIDGSLARVAGILDQAFARNDLPTTDDVRAIVALLKDAYVAGLLPLPSVDDSLAFRNFDALEVHLVDMILKRRADGRTVPLPQPG